MLAILLHSVFFAAVFKRQNVLWLQLRYSGQRTERVIGSRSFRLSTLGRKHCTFVSTEENTPALFQSTRNISLCIICGDNSSNACRLFSRKYFIDHRINIRKAFIREILRKKRVNTTKEIHFNPRYRKNMAAAWADYPQGNPEKRVVVKARLIWSLGRVKKWIWRPQRPETRWWHVFLKYLALFISKTQLFRLKKILHTSLKATGT